LGYVKNPWGNVISFFGEPYSVGTTGKCSNIGWYDLKVIVCTENWLK